MNPFSVLFGYMKVIAMFAVKSQQEDAQARQKGPKVARVEVKIEDQIPSPASSMHAENTAPIKVSNSFAPLHDT